MRNYTYVVCAIGRLRTHACTREGVHASVTPKRIRALLRVCVCVYVSVQVCVCVNNTYHETNALATFFSSRNTPRFSFPEASAMTRRVGAKPGW